MRVNQIFITGEVARAGAYSVSALGTAMNALYQPGGLTERGDLRGTRVIRAGKTAASLDLYDYLLRRDTHGYIRLESVRVAPSGNWPTSGFTVRP